MPWIRFFNMLFRKKKKLVTHDGSFHTDDIFAAAALSIYLENRKENFEILRTRDEAIIKSADYVFDVGGIHDPEQNRFDHHQLGGAGKRPNKMEYVFFGLVWKKFGAELTGSEKAMEIIDRKMAAPIDAFDNGFDLVSNKYKEVSPYFIQHIFFSMEPTWREEDLSHDEMFFKSVSLAREVLSREIIQVRDAVLAEELVISIYNNTKDKRIIIIDKRYPFQYILNNFSEPLYVVYPRKTNNWWGVKAVRQDPKSFNNRKSFPTAWAGLRDEELAKISGVADAVFCHKGLFMAVAKSKEGAVKLAQIAVESSV